MFHVMTRGIALGAMTLLLVGGGAPQREWDRIGSAQTGRNVGLDQGGHLGGVVAASRYGG